MNNEVSDFIILGRTIGTYSGWDLADTFVIQIYDFTPIEGVNIPKTNCIVFDFTLGIATVFDDDNNETNFDFVSLISHLPLEKNNEE